MNLGSGELGPGTGVGSFSSADIWEKYGHGTGGTPSGTVAAANAAAKARAEAAAKAKAAAEEEERKRIEAMGG